VCIVGSVASTRSSESCVVQWRLDSVLSSVEATEAATRCRRPQPVMSTEPMDCASADSSGDVVGSSSSSAADVVAPSRPAAAAADDDDDDDDDDDGLRQSALRLGYSSANHRGLMARLAAAPNVKGNSLNVCRSTVVCTLCVNAGHSSQSCLLCIASNVDDISQSINQSVNRVC